MRAIVISKYNLVVPLISFINGKNSINIMNFLYDCSGLVLHPKIDICLEF